jgi:hypothetical protein
VNGGFVDLLHLDTLTFPVLCGSLSRLRDESSDYCWCIEIHCGQSAEPAEKQKSDLDYVLGAEPYLYAQLLPLRVKTLAELIGRRYSFPQSPEDDPADWEPDQWPFFCLYLWEHDYVHPAALAFIAKRGRQYRVEIEGKYPIDGAYFDPRVQAWLDWKQ